ncbi:MAG TPA: hypothetical protein QGI30_03305 [Anaerolineales bacterium]|jgi:formate hydrogenlyase subunit 3/multisubunit Na+/H+ antiporter MnhD subunit|nr:hypothetical protein [Anaerolineales bacterium]|tara:strand:+ start:3695 stop:4129 length:435 start_codon:yes stop_codon:yes gene_type:complete
MLRALVSLVIRLVPSVVIRLFKQRWWQHLVYWFAILYLALGLLAVFAFIFVFNYDWMRTGSPPLLFRIDAFGGLMLLFNIAFFGWVVFAMRRELRKPQPERGQPARGQVQPRDKVAPRLHQEKEGSGEGGVGERLNTPSPHRQD